MRLHTEEEVRYGTQADKIQPGEFYLCPFTQIPKIWISDRIGGQSVVMDLDQSTHVKKCSAKRLESKAHRSKLEEAGKILSTL